MTTRETVIIEVEVEGGGFKKLAVDAKSLKKALRGLGDETDNANEGFRDTAELADKMRGALGPLGDVLGDATGFLADTTDALGGFSKMQVGVTAVVLAGVAGFFKFTGAIAETIASIDEMSEALRERGDPELNHAVSSIEKLSEKLERLSVTYDAQWVLMTNKFTPALGGLVEVADLVIPKIGSLTDSVFDLAFILSPTVQNLVKLGEVLGIVDEMADKAEAADRLGFSITDLDERWVALKNEFGEFGTSEELEGSFYAVSDATDDVKEALKASAAAAREAKREMRELAKATKKADDAAREASKRFLDSNTVLKDTTEASHVGGDAFNQLAEDVNFSGKKTKKSLQEMAQDAEASVGPFLNATSSVVSSVADLYNQATDSRIKNMKDGSKAQKKALREQFAANKAFGIVQATIQTAQAVMQALGSMPPPASIVFAALAGAAGAAQVAMIAAQKPPSFHRGGMMPDERTAFGGRAITRSNEAEVVITAHGQRTFADTINALNRGEHNAGGGVTVMLDSAPIRNVVYSLGQADPAYGHRVRQ